MRQSAYNYFVERVGSVIVFNGITERFFEVKESLADSYRMILESPEEYIDSFGPFIEKMKQDGFIIDDDTDEAADIEKKFMRSLCENQYYLMILPTYQCNVRCWYCVQDHRDLWMTEDVFNRIWKRLQIKSVDETIKHVHLSWFGGEPLLAYNKIVDFTRKAKELVISNGKHFTCNITTNGILLNPERIEKLRDAGVTSYQITIDGTKKYHDSVKRHISVSAYETSIRNVDTLARHTRCTLRFNYTHENLEPDEIMAELTERLTGESLSHISFMIFKVWQEGEERIPHDEVDRLFNMARANGMHPRLPRTGICYSDQKHFDCIFPDGSCEKCDNQSPTATRGTLTSDGNIVWEGEVDSYHPSTFRLKESECCHCCYLPICWGPCVAKRETMLKNFGKVRCLYSDRDKYMGNIICNIVQNVGS